MGKYNELWKICERQVIDSVEEPVMETEVFIQDSNGFVMATCDSSDDYYENLANAERIVDCVNACAGMADPVKEIAKLNKLKENIGCFIDDMKSGIYEGKMKLADLPDAIEDYFGGIL